MPLRDLRILPISYPARRCVHADRRAVKGSAIALNKGHALNNESIEVRQPMRRMSLIGDACQPAVPQLAMTARGIFLRKPAQ